MKQFTKWIAASLAVAVLASARIDAQQPDPNLKATYGAVTLKAGFTPDPFKINIQAGGPVRTNLGGVNAFVAKAPDLNLHYTKGNFPLIFRVKSEADTTLLINLPDGTWVANDDSDGVNPAIRIAKPQSGRYDIYVGTFRNGLAPATLFITEVDNAPAPKDPVDPPKPPVIDGKLPNCFVLSVGIDGYRTASRLSGCLNDARNTASAFKAQEGTLFGSVQTTLLLDETATTAGIAQKFQSFATSGRPGDYIVLFLSGHGGRMNGNKTWYFLPFDHHPQSMPPTIVTDRMILETADSLVRQKKRVFVIIDACFSGQLRNTAQPYLDRYQNQQEGGLVLMLSSSPSQTSAALGNFSAFAKAFADSMTSQGDLNKDGKVTLSEIQSYSSKRTSQLLTQSRIAEKQDSIVAWSPSISKDTLLASANRASSADPVRPPPSGKAQRWVGTETLAGFGKLSFSLYSDGRAVMVDARDTVEGTWTRKGQNMTLTFFNGSVVYQGTVNGASLAGTASGPASRMNTRTTWAWSTQMQP